MRDVPAKRPTVSSARTSRCTRPSRTTAPGLNTSLAAQATVPPETGQANVRSGRRSTTAPPADRAKGPRPQAASSGIHGRPGPPRLSGEELRTLTHVAVSVDDPEADVEPVEPLVVVGAGPMEEAADVRASLHRLPGRREAALAVVGALAVFVGADT